MVRSLDNYSHSLVLLNGGTGVGKTTGAQMAAEVTGGTAVLGKDPNHIYHFRNYLNAMGQRPNPYAYEVQMAFMMDSGEKANQIPELLERGPVFWEEHLWTNYLYVCRQREEGILSDEPFVSLTHLFLQYAHEIIHPTAVLHILPTLKTQLQRIRERSRMTEGEIDVNYYAQQRKQLVSLAREGTLLPHSVLLHPLLHEYHPPRPTTVMLKSEGEEFDFRTSEGIQAALREAMLVAPQLALQLAA